MRLLQAMAGGTHGGAETFFVRLASAFARAGLEQEAVIRTDPARAAALREARIPVREVRFGGPLDVRSRAVLRRAIAGFRPRVVLTWMSRATAACPRGEFVHIARLGGPYDLKYYRRCDHLVAITRGLRDRIVESGWPPDRVHVIGNFAEPIDAAAADRGREATPADAPLLLALGRLHPNKAFDVLIDAVRLLPPVHLWIAGEGPLRRVLADHAAARGVTDRVRLLGWRADTASLMAAADVVVVPSRREPHGTVVLEAWAQSRPLVAAAAEGPRELVRDGVDGVLVPTDDPEALAGAIGRVLEDRDVRARLAAAGRATLDAHHREAAVVGRYLDLFRRVAG